MRTQTKHKARFALLMLSGALLITGCTTGPSSQNNAAADRSVLVRAWRSKIVFRNGPLAEMKDLEFLYAYNTGGTMTESSNYDEAANSSPPAYGVWRQNAPRTFETKYVFYTTKESGPADGAPNSRDWWPAGHGVLTETITRADDGLTYVSTVKLATYDRAGALIAGTAEGTGAGTRIVF
jgi:hypothetical protein